MFKHWASRKQTQQGKYKGQKSKRHRWIVNTVRLQTHLLWGYQAKKEIH